MTTWQPINDFPGDQRLDLPPTDDASFWGEVGQQGDGWSWTIVASDGSSSWEEAQDTVDTEDEAKAAVENWRTS